MDGKISALLELGAGFNMDYTGIENIYMNGTMMGYTKKEMDAKLQDILEFAEIGDFVYQPVKTYSSGMFVRLAFALAINVDPEILIVDEALSVGDVFFQSKCYRRMEEIRQKGDVEMSDFSGGMGLEGSRLMKDQLTINYDRTEYGDGRAEIVDLGLFDERGNITNLLLKGEMFTIKERIHFNTEIQSPIFTYTIKDKKGTELTGTNTMFEGAEIQPVKRGDEYVVEFSQKMTLQGGEYLLSMSCTGFEQGEHVVYHRLYNVTNITVISNKNTVGVYDMESQVKAGKIEAGKIEAGNAGPTVNGGL